MPSNASAAMTEGNECAPRVATAQPPPSSTVTRGGRGTHALFASQTCSLEQSAVDWQRPRHAPERHR